MDKVKTLLNSVALLFGIQISSFAVAAPFCVKNAYGEDCFYYDVQSCQRAAGSTGMCVPNSKEQNGNSYGRQNRGSGAPFCVKTAYGEDCWYYDVQSCQRAAGSTGMCIPNQN